MRTRFLFIIFILIAMGAGCAKRVPVIIDNNSDQARLTERVQTFQSSLIDNNFEQAESITLQNNPYGSNATLYVESFKGGGHMAQYFKVDYELIGLEVRDNKAKSRIKYFIKDKEGSTPQEVTFVNFWVFSEGDWFFQIGGKDELYMPQGWW